MLRAALIGFSLIVLALLVITVPQPTFDPSRTMGVYMAESYDTDANYVIKLTDPADPYQVCRVVFSGPTTDAREVERLGEQVARLEQGR